MRLMLTFALQWACPNSTALVHRDMASTTETLWPGRIEYTKDTNLYGVPRNSSKNGDRYGW